MAQWTAGAGITIFRCACTGAAAGQELGMAACLVQNEGQRWNKHNYLLMHAMGANTGGQIGSVMAAAIMLSLLKGLHVI